MVINQITFMEQSPLLKVTCLTINQGICKTKDLFLCSQQPMKSTTLCTYYSRLSSYQTNQTYAFKLKNHIKCQLDATEVFTADLTACSTCFGHQYAHHQELKSIMQRLLPVVFRAVVFKLLVWCGAEGYVSGLQDAAASCKPDT